MFASSIHRIVFGVAFSVCLAVPLCVPFSASAEETLSQKIARQGQGADKAPMVIDANTLFYDDKNDLVIATGDVQIVQAGRRLQADKVRYDRKNSRVFAQGNVSVTDTQGNVTYSDQMELTDDFKDGFVNAMLMTTPQKTRFAANRAERVAGQTTTFQRGIYTACEPCKKDPTKAPIWQLKAKRVIHKEDERMLYYEDGLLEFFGYPIAWVPYLSAPDPTVKRKTGFLVPRYQTSNELGFGIELPFYYAPAPNYDLTLTPTITTRQGVLGRADWRHRTMTGAYDLRMAGIFQQEPGAFPAPPKGAGNRDFRGSVQTRGEFNINQKWTWGWNLNFITDKFFMSDYSLLNKDTNEMVSNVYLQALGDKNAFEANSYYFMGLNTADRQKYLPLVYPSVDHTYYFNKNPLGGELKLHSNVVNLTRDETEFVGYNPAVAGYAITRGSCAVYNKGRCIVMGASGSYTRASTELTWRRQYVDAIGQVWTPFAGLRADAYNYDMRTLGGLNANLANFYTGDNSAARVMPHMGLNYKYPFVARAFHITHTIEPIAQVVVRPREIGIGATPNEDAQSLIFDDTNLFAINRFSGWDRVEGGSRAAAGVQYSIRTDSGAWVSALVGQSYHLAERNSFTQIDPTHVGLDSGLDKSRSDLVTRLTVQPNSNYGMSIRTRNDDDTGALKRLEIAGNGNFGNLWSNVAYGRYAAQPNLAMPKREGVFGALNYRLSPNWQTGAAARYMIDRKKFDFTKFTLAYNDECTTVALDYLVDFSGFSNKDPVHKFFLRLNLRTLGDAGVSTSVGDTK